MKKIYTSTLALSFFVVLTSCTKEYEDRIEGTWQLEDVDRKGWGGSTSNLPFRDGQFEFNQGGTLTYTNNAGTVYKGSWDLRQERTYDSNGNTNYTTALQVTAVDFTTQEVRSEFFNEIKFFGRNKFRAYIYSGAHTYVFRFER